MKEKLEQSLAAILTKLGIEIDAKAAISLEYPENPEHGDFSTNLALSAAKKAGLKPRALAEKIVAAFNSSADKVKPDFVESVSIAGPGFINFKVKDKAFVDEVLNIAQKGIAKSTIGSNKLIMVEYTDPNPFKVFHIGHLMSNAIGESISRLVGYAGADVKRANWQGDVGPHVAKAIWAAMKEEMQEERIRMTSAKTAIAKEEAKLASWQDVINAAFWGKAYTMGAEAYETNETAKKEIAEINKKIYDRSDQFINGLYKVGRQESLDAFETIYKRLGTTFDNYFFEGIEGRNGEAIVKAHIKDGIFAESEGAIVFKGEDHGLHTRVFITSQGLPTYETKELGLNAEKFKLYPKLDQSIIVTANEQNDYFKVLVKVMSLVMPDVGSKTRHMSHGMMRFASGKMSSRKGNVISAESLIDEVKAMVKEKMAGRELSATEVDEIADIVAVAAIKYTVLRSSVGSDIIFDSVKSISFEGDSGPYLQYSAVRARSVLKKAGVETDFRGPASRPAGLAPDSRTPSRSPKLPSNSVSTPALQAPNHVGLLEKLISRFADIAARARTEYAPQLVATYLIELAGAFNSFYASNTIVDENETLSPYRIELTKAFLKTMTDGLWLLGIKVPRKM